MLKNGKQAYEKLTVGQISTGQLAKMFSMSISKLKFTKVGKILKLMSKIKTYNAKHYSSYYEQFLQSEKNAEG